MREDFLNALKMEDNMTETENGAVAYKSTLNACLDAFSLLGTMHKSSDEEILKVFDKAFNENPKLAMRLLFYVRDVRGGQGARRVFRTIMKHLAEFEPKLVIENRYNIAEFGRYDDFLCLLDTPLRKEISDFLRTCVATDLINIIGGGDTISLIGKWLPSENASSKESKRYAKMLIEDWKISPKSYRQMLVSLRRKLNVVETDMSSGNWNSIKFDEVPSKASLRYTNAFFRHSSNNYIQFLKDVAAGRTKINAATLFPVDIVKKITKMGWRTNVDDTQRKLYDAMWNALPNYFGDKEETGICVVDTSGSMYDGTSLEVALSLGLYCADKCKGPFKNHFITFSANPDLQEVRGRDIVEKVRAMSCADWGMNTNIKAVFDLLLTTAVRHRCPQSDIPSKIYIISDMQFDEARRVRYSSNETYLESLREEWSRYGYELPSIVYWNVRASKDGGMFQTTYNGIDCCIVGGYSASLFRDVINGTIVEVNEKGEKKEKLDPMVVMYKTLMSERYDCVYGG